MAGTGSSLLDLLSVQAGKETTWGTAVTPTVKLMGINDITLDPGVKVERFKDRRGSLGATYLAAFTEIMPKGKLKAYATYEDTPYILDSCFGEATPSGAGPYVRAYAAPLTAVPTSPRIMTLVYGDATNCYKVAGGLLSKTTFKGENGRPIEIDSELFGKQDSTGTLAALSDRTVTLAMGNHAAIYIDDWAGTIGTTAIATTAFAFELTIDPKRKPDQFLGALTASNWHEGEWDGELKLSMELNSTSTTFLSDAIGGSSMFQKQVRIKYTSGTSIIQLDFAGVAEDAPELFSDRDGVVTFEVTLKKLYNPTLANWFAASVTNSVATLV